MNDLRKKINKCDDEIIELLIERFNIAKSIGQFKEDHELPIEDLQREKEIINHLEGKLSNEDAGEYIVNIYREIFAQSKAYQKKHYNSRS